MSVSRPDAERAIHQFLRALGHDPDSDVLRGTPRRVVDAFADELLSGYATDVELLLAEGSEANDTRTSGIVVVNDISLSTVCPHHLMPAVGTASLAYIPGARVLGLGALPRLVHAYARRLSLQEQIGANVVEALTSHGARAAYCRLELRHSCLSARGAEQHHASVVTTTVGGDFSTREGLAALTLALGYSPQASP
jgi:GTP cyclohydrolase I